MKAHIFDGKSILIWGYGKEGQSTESFLKRLANPARIDIFQGVREDIDESAYDYIFKSPGIPLLGEYDRKKYTTQTNVFLGAYRDRVIGVTGTKGKSTTSSLLAKVLSDCTDKEVILMGNIGQPALDYYDSMTENTIVVYELSCHQLSTADVSPHVGVFLNLYEEHLDYYHTLEVYGAAKSRIGLFQGEEDYLFLGSEAPRLNVQSHLSVLDYSDIVEKRPYKLSIEGVHNQFNAEVVMRIARDIYGCDEEAVRKSLFTFTGLKHRLEHVIDDKGVRYFDDSISTIPEAAISALESIADARTILIGGMDRGIDYSKLEAYMKSHPEYNYICMYESGKRIYEAAGIKELAYTYLVDDLKSAVELARRITDMGAVLLSPAAPSYGYFKNFEERGEVYQAMVTHATML